MKKIIILLLTAALSVLSVSYLCSCAPDTSQNDAQTVRYADFGAVGDGVTDDFDAIANAHDYANEHNLPVAADFGARYYIGSHNATAIVRTDTDWGDAEFIVDDSEVSLKDRGRHIFEVRYDAPPFEVRLPSGYSLVRGQALLGLEFTAPVMLHVVNDNKKDYIRYGANQNGGSSRQEIILADADGTVNADTPLLWDYSEVTKMTAYSVSDAAITVRGGVFTTIANTQTVGTSYYARGINVTRSNTTLYGIEHYVTGEPIAEANPPADPTPGKSSAPYSGFFAVNNANNVTLRNCVVTGRAAYRYKKPTGWVTQGTYDIAATKSNNVSWIGCTQSNSLTDTAFWGVMTSNFCKNLLMDGCSLSRFDAHQGVYNATVKNTVLGRDFNIIGAGSLIMEKVERLAGDNFLWLRSDYGSTWEGDMIFKDCKMSAKNNFSIINASWTDWDFGFACYLPESVTVENFSFETNKKCYVFSDITSASPTAVASSKNPYAITENVSVSGATGGIYLTSNRSGLFSATRATGVLAL